MVSVVKRSWVAGKGGNMCAPPQELSSTARNDWVERDPGRRK